MRARGVIGPALAALLVAACGSTAPATTPPADPTPVPAGITGPARSFEPATGASVLDAAALLDELDSYRFTSTRGGGMASRTEGIVVKGPPRATLMTMSGQGMSTEQLQVGKDAWFRFSGADWQPEPGFADATDPDLEVDGSQFTNPVTSLLEEAGVGKGDAFGEVALESRNGITVRHVRLVAAPGANAAPTTGPVDNPLEVPFPDASEGVVIGPDGVPVGPDGLPIDDGLDAFDDFGIPFTGTVEAWIDVDTGRIVALRVDGTRDFGGIEDFTGLPGDGSAGASVPPDIFDEVDTVAGTIEISAVNDPANVVERPVIPDPTPTPTGDPKIVKLLDGLDRAADALDRYVYEIGAGTAGVDTTIRIAIVHGTVPAARIDMDMAQVGETSIVSIGDDLWSKDADGPWTTGTGTGFGCPGETVNGRCDLSSLGKVLLAYRSEPGTYERVGDEVVDGVKVIHVRSKAGLSADSTAGVSLPGTSDLWIAKKGGYLVKLSFVSMAMTVTAAISNVNDPTLTIERPVP